MFPSPLVSTRLLTTCTLIPIIVGKITVYKCIYWPHCVKTFFWHYWYHYHTQSCYGSLAKDKLMNVTHVQQTGLSMSRGITQTQQNICELYSWCCLKRFTVFQIATGDSKKGSYNALYLLDQTKQPCLLHKPNQHKLSSSICSTTGIFQYSIRKQTPSICYSLVPGQQKRKYYCHKGQGKYINYSLTATEWVLNFSFQFYHFTKEHEFQRDEEHELVVPCQINGCQCKQSCLQSHRILLFCWWAVVMLKAVMSSTTVPNTKPLPNTKLIITAKFNMVNVTLIPTLGP